MTNTEMVVTEKMVESAIGHFEELSKGSDLFWDIALETMDVVDPALMERVMPGFREILLQRLKESTSN